MFQTSTPILTEGGARPIWFEINFYYGEFVHNKWFQPLDSAFDPLFLHQLLLTGFDIHSADLIQEDKIIIMTINRIVVLGYKEPLYLEFLGRFSC